MDWTIVGPIIGICLFLLICVLWPEPRHIYEIDAPPPNYSLEDEDAERAERKARKLFRKSLPKQASCYARNGYAWIESKTYEISYKVFGNQIEVYRPDHRTPIGSICIFITAELPRADAVLQFCLLLTSDEESVLKRGNWRKEFVRSDRDAKALIALENLTKPIIRKRRINGQIDYLKP